MAIHSIKITIDGYKFDSVPEARFYSLCKLMKERGEIKDFEIQVPYELIPECTDFKGGKSRPTRHDIDFKIWLNEPHFGSDFILVDTKDAGDFAEKEAILKRKLWMFQNQGIPYYFIAQVQLLFLGGKKTKLWVNRKKKGSPEKERFDKLKPEQQAYVEWSIHSPWVEMSSGTKFLNKLKSKHTSMHGKQNTSNKTLWTPEKEWAYFFEFDRIGNLFYTFEGNITLKKAYKSAVEGGLKNMIYEPPKPKPKKPKTK